MQKSFRLLLISLAVLLALSSLFACKKEEVEEEGWGELAEKWPIFANSMSEITKNAAFLDKTQYRYEKATSDRLERLETELGILLKLNFDGKLKAGVIIQKIDTKEQCTVLEFETAEYAERFATAYKDYLSRTSADTYIVKFVGNIAAYSIAK